MTASMNIAAKSAEDTINIQARHNSTLIWVTFDKVGFHRYPDAPEEVKYLRDVHRHLFKFRVDISVFHDDREIEFHMFKNWLTSLYEGGALQVDHKSCEMLAQDLLHQILGKYNCLNRRVVVTVSEDDECGASLISDPGIPMPLSREWIKDMYLNMATADAAKQEQPSKAARKTGRRA